MFDLPFSIRMLISTSVSLFGVIVILLLNIDPNNTIPGFIAGAFGFQIMDHIIFYLRH